MPNSPSSSFIPKQGPARHSRQLVSRQVHLFTVLSYILFFSALAASAGVFLYTKHIDNQLRDEVVALDSAIANFSKEKMEEVKAFNVRLMQVQDRLSHSVSAVSVFKSLEESAVQSATIESLSLAREGDQTFVITAEINTDTFDSVLFQRGLYERNPVIESVSFEDISLGQTDTQEDAPRSGVSFKAELQVPLTAVPYMPEGTIVPVTDMTVVEVGTSTPTTTSAAAEDLSANELSI